LAYFYHMQPSEIKGLRNDELEALLTAKHEAESHGE